MSLTLKNVHFTPDSGKVAELKKVHKCPHLLVEFTMPEIHADGINWRNLAQNISFDCRHITVYNPTTLLSGRPKEDTTSSTPQKKGIETFGARIIDIINPTITYHYSNDSTEYTLKVKGGKVRFNDWKLDTRKGMDTSTFLFAHNSVINFDSFSYYKKNSSYNISSAGIGLSTGNRDLTLKHVVLKLTSRKDEYYKKIGEQREIYDFHFPEVRFAGLNWKDLINGVQLYSDTMNIYNPELGLYYSRKYPAPKTTKVGNYPHQLLRSMGLKLNIKTLNIENGDFKYTEENEITNKEATISFSHVKGVLKNVTNIDTLINKNDKCTVNMHCHYMQDGDITANFQLLLSDPKGAFVIDGVARNIQARDIDQTTKTLALTEVRSFNMSQLDMHIEGDQTYGKGLITMRYTGLELAFLKLNSETNKPDERGLGMLAFLANKLVLFPSNPMPGKEVRSVSTYVKRDAYKGFFNLIWKNIFQGAKNTAMRGPDLVDNIKEKQNPEKKGLLRKLFSKNR